MSRASKFYTVLSNFFFDITIQSSGIQTSLLGIFCSEFVHPFLAVLLKVLTWQQCGVVVTFSNNLSRIFYTN